MSDPQLHERPLALTLALPFALATACAAPAEYTRRPPTQLAWPATSAAPRIDYEFAYGGTADTLRHPGFFGWLLGLLAGDDEQQLVSPAGLALTGDVLWIADPGAACVHRLELASGEHRLCRGHEQQPFATPIGIAALVNGQVCVTDAATATLTILAADGTAVRWFGGPDRIQRPTGIAYDQARDRLLVVDTVGCRLAVFDRAGTVLATRGERGTAPGQFNYPTHCALAADGRVVVVDSLNFRIQVLSADLEPLHAFGRVGRGPGDFASPKGLAVDAHDHIYVVDSMFDNVQVFDFEGRLLLAFAGSGHDLGQLWLPAGIHIDANDRIFVADAGNARVQVMRLFLGAP